MPTFNFSVTNKVVSHANANPCYVHGNTDYVVHVSFDEEWAEFVTKTARLRWLSNAAVMYRDIVFTGDSFELPALYGMEYIEVGFFAGNKHTTTPGVIRCEESILTGNPTEDDPDPDVYAQLLDLIQEGAVKGMSPYIGENLHWYEWDDENHMFVDTGITARGEVTIHAPYIGDNRNWYQFDASTETYVNTGIRAEGVKGHPGIYTNSDIEMVEDLTLLDVAWHELSPTPTLWDPPVVGDPVFFTATSAVGIITAVRPTTISGPKFDVTYHSSLIGETGPQGPQGAQGETGPQGPQGDDYVLTSTDKQDIADIVKDDITIPTKLSELTGDSTHRVVTDAEKTAWDSKQGTIADLATIRAGAALGNTALQSVPSTYRLSGEQDTIDAGLSSRIDAIAAQSDVKDVVGTHAELLAYTTSSLTVGDVIKVLVDETKSDAECYWRFSSGNNWTFVGESADTYSKTASNALLANKIDKAVKRVYLEGTTADGRINRSTGASVGLTDEMHLTVNVVPGKTYYVSGTAYASPFPLIVEYDETDAIIGGYKTVSSTTAIVDEPFTVPAGCVKIAVNSRKPQDFPGVQYPSVYYIENAEQTGNTIDAGLKGKQSMVVAWEEVGTRVSGKYIRISSNKKAAEKASAGYQYVKATYDKNKRYRFYGTSNVSGGVFLVFCVDENDYIIRTDYGTGSIHVREEITIPENTKYLYVNSSGVTNARIEVAVERDITSFEAGKVGVFLGDSITQGTGVFIYTSTIPFQDYPTVVGDILNCTKYNGGLGGACWHGTRSIDAKNVVNCIVSGDFSTVIAGISQYGLHASAIAQYNAIAELDFNAVDFVCLSFGTNDWNFGYTAAQVKAAMEYCISALLTAYPKLKIYVLTPIYRYKLGTSGSYDSDEYTNPNSGLKLREICEAIIEASHAAHVPCKDMYYESGLSQYNRETFFTSDGTHLKAAGYAVYGEKVAKFIDS